MLPKQPGKLLQSLMVVMLVSTFGFSGLKAECAMGQFEDQRRRMVERQIVARDVTAPAVIDAMQVVPRHCFVPDDLRHLAYQDRPLPIGYDQTISQPYMVAKMSELLALKPGHRVLEVGTGSGYQAAVLDAMGVQVYTIEIVAPLGRQSSEVLKALGYQRIETKIGDGYKGWPRHAPFDGIIVTCAPTHIPEPLKAQLAEGGRMVIPVGKAYGRQRLFLLRKIGGRIKEEKIFEVRFVPMVDEKGTRY